MHRHAYQGRKFHRERDQRKALIKSLADSLIRDESIETTLSKAKEIVPYVEKLITKAKKGDLHNRRLIIANLQTISSAHKLIDELAPKLSSRNSGHLQIERTKIRRGDNTQMARVSFVAFDVAKKPEVDKPKPVSATKTPAKKAAAPAKKKPAAPKKQEAKV